MTTKTAALTLVFGLILVTGGDADAKPEETKNSEIILPSDVTLTVTSSTCSNIKVGTTSIDFWLPAKRDRILLERPRKHDFNKREELYVAAPDASFAAPTQEYRSRDSGDDLVILHLDGRGGFTGQRIRAVVRQEIKMVRGGPASQPTTRVKAAPGKPCLVVYSVKGTPRTSL